MKLSEQLKQEHECGDFGNALEGYSERAEAMEKILSLFNKDLYSPSGKITKKTARAAVKYTNDNGIEV